MTKVPTLTIPFFVAFDPDTTPNVKPRILWLEDRQSELVTLLFRKRALGQALESKITDELAELTREIMWRAEAISAEEKHQKSRQFAESSSPTAPCPTNYEVGLS